MQSSTGRERPKVLLIGMLDSIHFARWIAQLEGLEMDFVITGTSPYRKIRPELSAFITEHQSQFAIKEIFPRVVVFGMRLLPAAAFLLDRICRDRVRGRFLSRLIAREQPDLVHVNELIIAGFAFEAAIRSMRGDVPRIWLTNYGSELVWRLQSKPDLARAKNLLQHSSHFSAECSRDVEIARQLGFRGEVLPVIPVSGGLPVSNLNASPQRAVLAVKGYDNRIGLGVEALKRVADFMRQRPDLDLRCIAFASNLKTRLLAAKLRSQGIKVTAVAKGKLSHSEMMTLFRESVVYVGASRSDGISTSAIEAMANGAIPIQTSTSCASEWFTDGATGFSVDPDNLDEITRALHKVFSREFELSKARISNQEVIRRKASPSFVRDSARESYKRVIFRDD